jgi:hypothetical protein
MAEANFPSVLNELSTKNFSPPIPGQQLILYSGSRNGVPNRQVAECKSRRVGLCWSITNGHGD